MFSKLLGLALWSLVAVAAGLALERGVVGTYQKWFALNGGSLGESSALSPRQLFWCDFGDTPCGDGCMPLGDVCCGIINPGYCLKGYTCLDNGCCPVHDRWTQHGSSVQHYEDYECFEVDKLRCEPAGLDVYQGHTNRTEDE
ncbi:hypothetical protein M406DRAFT_325270 [Cryphonectria parasitica EP155]|uniref:Uncharacterized protein n=1 Tax=Cryphonectria parasitica (strain ATCC 38755 / EP155) TaxID=660469 RepID=A0A9P4YAH9_CRYP1|nr:uncharacterized protein M406DRAFT_325270 [Cryphonectria parasitica EP155]KAF3769786.1 hypothetical protein M406DRAFT_325270 [Cryphonectria parasitica EP155]